MPATSPDYRSSRATGSRFPLTPKVTSSRRGGHLSPRPVRKPAEAAAAAATPAMHITPNVVSAVRGRLSLRAQSSITDAFNAGALDMRGLRL